MIHGVPPVTNIKIISLGLNDLQSVTSLIDTAINFTTEDIKDVDFEHSTTVNPSRITVISDGRYSIEGFISVVGTAGNYRLTMTCAIRVNGTTTRQYIDSTYIRATTGANASNIVVFDVLELKANDYIEIMVARISTTVGDGTTAPNKTKIIMTKLK